jgi:CubicO group peptidase (beta-lactamase class C family)
LVLLSIFPLSSSDLDGGNVPGFCDDKFVGVGDAFAQNFANGEEIGASVAITIDGEFVVDLWDGLAAEGGADWQEDTIVNVYSTTKTMTALCIHILADRDELSFESPVGSYWPEFKAAGKQDITVAHVMSHQSGLSGWDLPIEPTDLYDWEKCTALLAAQEPWWEPGSSCGYHAVTQGYLLGEVLRRITGQTIGEFFAANVSGPLDADFHIGLDASHDARVGELKPPGIAPEAYGVEPGSIAHRTLRNPRLTAEEPRTRAWRAAEIPAAGGFGNARSVSRVHSAIACGGEVDGVRIHSSKVISRIVSEQCSGIDQVLGMQQRYGLGYGLATAEMPLPSPRAFFWAGWGGSLAIIDPDLRMTVSYVMNRMYPSLIGDMRGPLIALAAYGAAMS